MKSRSQKYIYGLMIGMLALCVTSGPAFADQEQDINEMKEITRQQQEQIDAQAKALEEMKSRLEMMSMEKKEGAGGMMGGPFVLKGNKKSSVTLYGHINRALLAADDGEDSDVYQVDNTASQSRFGIKGTIHASKDVTFGTLLEAGLNVNPSDAVSQDSPRDNGDSTFTRRHVDLYAKHNSCGTLSMGHGSTASDDTTNIDLSGSSLAGDSSVSDFAGGLQFVDKSTKSLSGISIGDVFNSMDGLGRDVRVRYDTPAFAGAMASGSWVADGGGDVALRYDGKLSDIKVVGAVAYAKPRGASTTVDNQYDGSVAMLLDSGVNMAVAGGMQEYKQNGSDDGSFYYIKLGYRDDIFLSGETRFAIDFGQYDDNLTVSGGVAHQYGKGDVIGAQVVHELENLGTELYAGYRYYSLESDYEDIHALMTGLRVKF
ncbi:hypothetical protein DSLASN_35600 [Desulfoluna limicola]|uniref:Porin domain-containing protein n=1 Tax=Desulfoluna limicola TaxID=2810562 RepID=A0ABM7PL67_9BACT|nr:hypothetical protein [Desulfoluna limicola]BCS97928.1 hypothetical protein DSLASN_35600 [Desulfoluna limicola]